MNKFENINQEINSLIERWIPKLSNLDEQIISTRRNKQHRSIKQILGHMIDSASNNTHRIIHLQYQDSPISFPDYANLGNNDRWIAIQNYQEENWHNMLQLWKYANIHFLHVVNNVDNSKLNTVWLNAYKEPITLEEMILGYLPHFKLHLNEIEALLI